MNTPLHPLDPDEGRVAVEDSPMAAPTGVKVVVNGRTVLHRHFLQQAMDAMVRRALAEEALASPN